MQMQRRRDAVTVGLRAEGGLDAGESGRNGGGGTSPRGIGCVSSHFSISLFHHPDPLPLSLPLPPTHNSAPVSLYRSPSLSPSLPPSLSPLAPSSTPLPSLSQLRSGDAFSRRMRFMPFMSELDS